MKNSGHNLNTFSTSFLLSGIVQYLPGRSGKEKLLVGGLSAFVSAGSPPAGPLFGRGGGPPGLLPGSVHMVSLYEGGLLKIGKNQKFALTSHIDASKWTDMILTKARTIGPGPVAGGP